MEQIIILSNIGSTSKKYSVYKDAQECAWFHIEKNNTEYICSSKINSFFEKKHITEDVYETSLEYVVQNLISFSLIQSCKDINVIGLRVVVPCGDFVQDMICDESTYQKLKESEDIDPIHITPVLHEIEMAKKLFPPQIKIYLISDSMFHKVSQKQIALPFKTPLYTIGYHGLACESVLRILAKNSITYSKLVIVHLGGGSSVTGIVHQKSCYNSMQFSPLGGMLMSSRSGSVDPFLILLYMKEYNLSYQETIDHLYTKSGLLALSTISSDLRVVREHAMGGDQKAKQAIMSFVDSIVSEILRALSYTQGADTLVFSGTIGIRAIYIRELVIEKLAWLGYRVNHSQNTDGGDECFSISSHDSKINIYVIHIDEMKEMYQHVHIILDNLKK